MNKYFGIIISVFIAMSVSAGAQDNRYDCSILKNGTFKYMDLQDTTAYIVIKGTEHNEYFNSKKYYITSRIRWVNDCNYIMTMTEITVPNFPYSPGDMMSVQVDSIENRIVYYTSTVNGQSLPGRMKILNVGQ